MTRDCGHSTGALGSRYSNLTGRLGDRKRKLSFLPPIVFCDM
ncbi:unnamed protein product [Staurois parvus]|uniref:Uncharacterized protein n=1 Tax=Staurois parvus TaxID=386267 RepID=A0ABN9ERU9_9NEOB|nr:unnamed protein product [Staurois parvus]